MGTGGVIGVETGGTLGVGGSRRQSCVVAERVPVRTVQLLRVMVMVMVFFSKKMSQPWSQSWPMERREPEARDGKMCAVRAEMGREGKSSRAV